MDCDEIIDLSVSRNMQNLFDEDPEEIYVQIKSGLRAGTIARLNVGRNVTRRYYGSYKCKIQVDGRRAFTVEHMNLYYLKGYRGETHFKEVSIDDLEAPLDMMGREVKVGQAVSSMIQLREGFTMCVGTVRKFNAKNQPLIEFYLFGDGTTTKMERTVRETKRLLIIDDGTVDALLLAKLSS